MNICSSNLFYVQKFRLLPVLFVLFWLLFIAAFLFFFCIKSMCLSNISNMFVSEMYAIQPILFCLLFLLFVRSVLVTVYCFILIYITNNCYKPCFDFRLLDYSTFVIQMLRWSLCDKYMHIGLDGILFRGRQIVARHVVR